MEKAKSILFFILLFLILSGTLVKCNKNEKCIKEHSYDQHLKISRITSSNNKLYLNNENSERQYGEEKLYLSRDKRSAKKPERFDLIKKLNEEKKLKKKDFITTDEQPKLEPNLTGIRFSEPHYGGIKTEQSYNKNHDKMQQLKAFTHAEREQNFIMPGTECNFERKCSWKWNTINEFFVTSSDFYKEHNIGPKADPFGNVDGKFLIITLMEHSKYLQVKSPLFNPSNETCKLEFWLYQEAMTNRTIKIATDNINHTQTEIDLIEGNDEKQWTKYEKIIGKIPNNFNILIEVIPLANRANGSLIAIDNIKLSNCFNEEVSNTSCRPLEFKCSSTNVCINNSQVCDITRDCLYGDDETQNCDKMPYGARCNFEQDWCGWYNTEGRILQWTRHNGTTSVNDTVPSFDHTYENRTGNYLHVETHFSKTAAFASIATLRSVTFYPPPRVHGNVSSRYYNCCTIRFYLHQLGTHKSGFMLQVTELRPKENVSTDLLWSYSNYKDTWVRQVVKLPNITHKYFLHFEVRKGIRYMKSIAIDDFSLSPECFGLNIPLEELNGYNYWNPYVEQINKPHEDFRNVTHYEITTCGATGRYGPSQENCTEAYNNTNVKVKVLNSPGTSGIQKWTVPSEGYYTLIVYGASGGKGSSGMGSSRGAMIRTVVELKKNQELFILVGQEGTNACVRSLGHYQSSSCQSVKNVTDKDLIKAVHNMEVTGGSGGGGGASYVFMRTRMNKFLPLAIAAGGGGLGLGKFYDTGLQHGQAINMSKPGVTGEMYGKSPGGAGGGWTKSAGNIFPELESLMGKSLLHGSIGGQVCNSTDSRGDGGFGGGGGGCQVGGGGGGYAGGNSGSFKKATNGEGGYSFLDSNKTIPTLSEVLSGYHAGPGVVIILPAVQGCGCYYRCLALDIRRSQVACICPKNWILGSDGKSCILIDGGETYPTWFVGVLIASFICLTAALSVICFILYNRYQQRAAEVLRRKMLSGPDLQLNRLRVASDSMMTEYNPNYEFGGVVYTIKDLKDIPRDQLRLVKALGQGAFGEVYQGFYRQRSGDTVEMPVAVKTLPEMSTNQAEMDFLMEALIMSKFHHPNIVHFIGVCFDKHPRFIVLELLAGGDLKNFLRESRPKPERGSPLTMKDLILISIDVAKGCKYLEENRFIHRDIAARNCLLTTKGPGRVVKIADFGMSRDIYRSDYYRKGGKAMLPIKWMPPEAFLDGIFTSKTDVWSFGVLLWEIMSMGYMPYTGCANRDVMQLVTSGGRLEPPANCPGPIYGIMTQCWHPTPEQRPTFALILERLGYCSQDPQVMNALLPVFNRPPSHERDATVMRPHSNDNNCLQVPLTTDYLIPNHTIPMRNTVGSTSSVDKLLPDNSDSWETSFVIPHSKSTQPLLQEIEPTIEENCTSNEKLLDIDKTLKLKSNKLSPLPNNIHNHNNNSKSELNNLKSGVSLDASALVKQSIPDSQKYANITTGDNNKTGNGVIQNGPYNNQNFLTNSKKYVNEPEITC